MGPTAVRLLLIAIAAVVLGVSLVAVATSETEDVALGQLYSTDVGDPLDVLAEAGDRPGSVCTNVGGFGYGAAIACTATEDLDQTGSWELFPGTSAFVKPLVLGVLPADAERAVVRIGGREVTARTRGRWFLAVLEPGSLGPDNASPVAVSFES